MLAEENKNRTNRRESTATALRLKPKSEVAIEDYYPTFLDMLKNVLDGNMDANNYEDTLREMYGIHAYMAFTLDRVSFLFPYNYFVVMFLTRKKLYDLGCIKCCKATATLCN